LLRRFAPPKDVTCNLLILKATSFPMFSPQRGLGRSQLTAINATTASTQ
jgi:hypothetical protein